VASTDTIHPLKDVWLRPRRVFRELATSPIGATDYLLAAAPGVATVIAFYRTPLMVGIHLGARGVLGRAILFGPVIGVLTMVLVTAIYMRLGLRAGGMPARNQVFHVLAYGSVPLAASLLLWGFTVLFVGEAAIVDTPGAEDDAFVGFVLRAQFAASVLLQLWSIVLQAMGLSEVLGLAMRKALGVWFLGQILAALAVFFLFTLLAILFPGLLPALPH
jgi:hypothetical protein